MASRPLPRIGRGNFCTGSSNEYLLSTPIFIPISKTRSTGTGWYHVETVVGGLIAASGNLTRLWARHGRSTTNRRS